MHLSKRIISVLCVITIVISAISPAFAYSATDGFNPVSFWEYVYRGFGGGNRDGGFGGGGFGGSDPDSWTTSDDMKNDYNDFVSTLPATGYNSAGKLLWQPKWENMTVNSFRLIRNSTLLKNEPLIFPYWDQRCYVGLKACGSVMQLSLPALPNLMKLSFVFSTSAEFSAPISGYYSCLNSSATHFSYFNGDNSYSDERNWLSKQFGLCFSGYSFSLSSLLTKCSYCSGPACSHLVPYRSDGYLVSGSGIFTTPVFEITPYSDDTTINYTYNINTRVNNFQGDYYDSVTNNYYNNTTIINETTNNYYDMTTTNYYTMSNWSYDYQSRTYFVTLEDGTTITVQFGDDCLTITNNNVENSYQYVINNNNTPSPNPETPSTCKHNWTETIDVAPTCLEGGHANFTCSLCGETYEQILSAKGHNWTVKEHVNTVYGESGVIVTQGHTLYECSACGEQWYTETATPPPDVSGGSNILAWLQEFKTWLGDKLDNLFQGDGDTNNFWSTNKKSFTDVLSSLLQILLDFLTDILEKLLGLVKDLLSFLFDLISSVVITGISDFFTGLKDSRLFDFVVRDDEGSVTALPEGVATVFAFFSGVILALPVELRSILLFGTAINVLIGVIKIIKS